MNLSQKFIVISDQRSGSTFLCNKLESYESILCHGEVFLNKFIPERFIKYSKKTFLIKLMTSKFVLNFKRILSFFGFSIKLPYGSSFNKEIKTYLDALYNDPSFSLPHYSDKINRQNINAIGFKIMYNQILNLEHIFHYVENNNVKIILLRRKTLDKFVSREIAKKTSVYHSNEDGNKIKSIYINPWYYKLFIAKTRLDEKNIINRLKNAALIYVDYEKIVSNQSDILDFLNIKNRVTGGVNRSLNKVIKSKLNEIVINYDRISKI